MTVTRDNVILAYRMILGREPESEAAIRDHQAVDDVHTLGKLFLGSKEALRRMPGSHAPLPGLRIDLPALAIDTEASELELAAALVKIKTAWTHLGLTRAHHSVLTNKDFLPQNFTAANELAFWESGELEAARVFQIMERFGGGDPKRQVCVDFGCGVGRVTTQLAKGFLEVHGYDISAAHLDYAGRRAGSLGLGNVQLHECAANPTDKFLSCDVFYSMIVLQHNPPIIIARQIRNALKSLRPGGLAIFQVPTYRPGYCFKTAEWLAAGQTLDMQMHCIPQAIVFRIMREEGCVPLDVREDNATGRMDLFLSNQFVVKKLRSRIPEAWRRAGRKLAQAGSGALAGNP